MEEKEMLDAQEVKTEEVSSVAEETPKAPETPVSDAEENEIKPMSKKRKILNGIILGVQIAFVVVAIVICLIVMLNPQGAKVSPIGLKLLPVLSGSMDGTEKDSFPKGALVFATAPKNNGEDLKVGQIVTFPMIEEESNTEILVTHRIINVIELEPGLVKYETKGDANPWPDEYLKLPGDIKAVYAFHINGLGAALAWIRDGYHFIYVIIIPLGLLLIYNIYLVAQIVVESKMKKAKAAAAESAKQAALASINEEEIKRKAIEEYLKSQAAAAAAAPVAPSDEKGDTE